MITVDYESGQILRFVIRERTRQEGCCGGADFRIELLAEPLQTQLKTPAQPLMLGAADFAVYLKIDVSAENAARVARTVGARPDVANVTLIGEYARASPTSNVPSILRGTAVARRWPSAITACSVGRPNSGSPVCTTRFIVSSPR
jgi:hypothetical protein